MFWHSTLWEFETDRLRVLPWRSRGDGPLATFLAVALTSEVTRELPPSWQAGVTPTSAGDWIAARDREGVMFLVETKERDEPVGVFMFFPDETPERNVVRLGYVFVEAAWGCGYATELVWGFLGRWESRGAPGLLLAGVTVGNTASQRVLEKNGFVRAGERDGVIEYRRAR